MYHGLPIIGLSGGIGSGKSFVAGLFGELGCFVIDSDAQVRLAYELPEVKDELRRWWGNDAFDGNGNVSRSSVARRVFSDPAERSRLEALIHPLVARMRDEQMRAAIVRRDASGSPLKVSAPARGGPVAFVWDTPLLFETGLDAECDALVFVEAPLPVRLERVRGRGWDGGELARREILQWGLDRKREISEYRVTSSADTHNVRSQVRSVLSRILARLPRGTGLE